MNMRRIVCAFFLLWCGLSFMTAQSNDIQTKDSLLYMLLNENGQTLTGEIVWEDSTTVYFKDISGKMSKLISKNQIKEIHAISQDELPSVMAKENKLKTNPNFAGDVELSFSFGTCWGLGATALYGYRLSSRWFVGAGTGLSLKWFDENFVSHDSETGSYDMRMYRFGHFCIPVYVAGKHRFAENNRLVPFVELKVGTLIDFEDSPAAGFYAQLKGGIELEHFKVSGGLSINTHNNIYHNNYTFSSYYYLFVRAVETTAQISFGYLF